jgi:hypothetical protein
MTRNVTIIGTVLLLLVAAGGIFAIGNFAYKATPGTEVPITATTTANNVYTSTPTPAPVTPPVQSGYVPYGEVTLALGQTAVFKDVRITPKVVVQDNRCPLKVQCITAGTVVVSLYISSSLQETKNISIDESIQSGPVTIILGKVSPAPRAGEPLEGGAYRFTFSVIKNTQTSGECFIGGCSNQLCTDKKDMVSTCEYTASYACYKSAQCKRQSTGQCGWTDTPELRACLLNPAPTL